MDAQIDELRSLRGQRQDVEEDYFRAARWEPAPRPGWWIERHPDGSLGRTAPRRDALWMIDRDLDDALRASEREQHQGQEQGEHGRTVAPFGCRGEVPR